MGANGRPPSFLCNRMRSALFGRERIAAIACVIVLLLMLYWRHDYCWQSRSRLEGLLVKSAAALDEAGEDWWLDWGTLLGHHRDGSLIEHEYDLDLAISEEACAAMPKHKHVFEKHGLTLITRNDYVATKRKPTWDTEKGRLVLSSGYIHSPCLRIYYGMYLFVDVYAYRRVTPEAARKMKAEGTRFDPPIYNLDGTKSNGEIPNTDMLCIDSAIDAGEWERGACRHYETVYPLKRGTLNGVPIRTSNDPDRILPELYGETWRTPITKGLRSPLCYFGMK